MKETCKTCRFWRADPCLHDGGTYPKDELGVCRRYPPNVLVQSADESDPNDIAEENPLCWTFPAVASGDWCGEHQATKPDNVIGAFSG